MKKVLEVVGFLAVVQGGLGLLRRFTGWRVGVTHQVAFLDGHLVLVSLLLIGLGLGLFAVAEKRGGQD
ncbi:hypothetical protein [Kitasatospora viridis]|uniref:Uncharacterized protein n=1 Tax=Kitasatospora viridis TaxID=281105 RepID=A0A561SEK4_9ACTN|nr:hypothetical protein [Kitasatospora viridis]TWF73294.1 hypothetical protein FHX73_16445 [Kitasatospora viridis]